MTRPLDVVRWVPWLRDRHGSVSPASAPSLLTFPTTPLTANVMLAFGANPAADPRSSWSWTDVTGYVFQSSDRIRITRGRTSEQTQASPSRTTLTFNNTDERFSPRNAAGPYYGTFGRNTPQRVDVDPGTGMVTRSVGFITAWPPRTDVSENLSTVSVQADGILRRLGQGSSPIKSCARLNIDSSIALGGVAVGYWPLEDAGGSTQATSGLLTGSSMTVSGTVTFADTTPPAGVATAPTLTAGSLTGTCLPATTAVGWAVSLYLKCTGTCNVLRWDTTGTLRSWTLNITASTLTVTPGSGTPVTISANYADGEWHAVQVVAFNNGADVVIGVFADNDFGSGGAFGATAGRVPTVVINPDTDADLASVTHLAVNGTGVALSNYLQMLGLPGQRAGQNFNTVASAYSVAVDVSFADRTASEYMGAYPVATLLETLQQCAAADEGVLTERRDGRLGFDSHADRENQAVAFTLDFALGQILEPFEPTEDDRFTRNDVTVTRTNGSSGRVVDATGTLGTARVGTYDDSATLNLYTDSQTMLHAAYRVNQGTVDEARYPQVRFNLTRSPELIASWLACDIGSRVQILHPPLGLPPDIIDQVIEGYTETIDPYNWDVVLNLSPFSPHRIFRTAQAAGDLDEFLGYLIPTTCVLAEDLDASETDVDVTSDTLWSTDPDDWTPVVPVRVGGEIMLVSAVAGGSNPQTLTVTRGAMDTIAATHPSGATLEFVFPGVLAL
jgi:hypothetical protein